MITALVRRKQLTKPLVMRIKGQHGALLAEQLRKFIKETDSKLLHVVDDLTQMCKLAIDLAKSQKEL